MKPRRPRLHLYGNSNRRNLLLGSSLPPAQSSRKRTCLRSLIGRKALQNLQSDPKIPGPKRPKPEIREFTTRNLKEIWRKEGVKDSLKNKRKEWEVVENSKLRGEWVLQNAWNRDAKLTRTIKRPQYDRFGSFYDLGISWQIEFGFLSKS